MANSVPIASSFRSRRHGVREVFDVALTNRRSYLGFVIGLVATLVVVASAFAYLTSRPDLFAFWAR